MHSILRQIDTAPFITMIGTIAATITHIAVVNTAARFTFELGLRAIWKKSNVRMTQTIQEYNNSNGDLKTKNNEDESQRT